ncbi:hypothetical protein VPH35_140149 [Triticum aestivum]|uniref:F-box domain-containing protein n=1 Tax=Triticum aestivum TaxID=4565 RepID=A0A3B6TYK7_WHEAT|nr:F-box protein At5g18160-like [Triticum aestivum]
MPDKKGATMLEDLPGEIMDMILIRLPSKDVGRCRVVNTSWRSATSTPKFMLEHHRRQPLVPIVDAHGRAVSHVVFGDVGGGTSSQELWPLVREGNLSFTLKGSCDGFLIIYHHTQPSFFICNPVTRKYVILPQPQGQFNFVIGFYRHHPTGEYRVLWFSLSHDSSKSSVYVLTVGSDKPRRIIVKIPTVSSPSVENRLMNEVHFSSGFSPPVHHRGSLHWWLSGSSDITGGCADTIVFDTEAESFRWMRSPGQHCPNSMLFDMKGTLAFWAGSTPASFSTMDVWVMQDYEAQIWAFKYRIELSTVEASRQLYLTSYKKKKRTPIDSMVQSFNDMAVLNERELLVRFNGKHVLHCDVDGKFLGLVKIGKNQHCMRLAHYRLQESILPIPSHEMHQG